MPRVCLTASDRLVVEKEKRDRKLTALIEGKMIEHNISTESLAKSCGMNLSSLYRRLRSPGERLSVAELSILVGVLRISNEELCHALR